MTTPASHTAQMQAAPAWPWLIQAVIAATVASRSACGANDM